MPEIVNHQRSEEWLLARRGLITASLGAAVLGLSPYKTRQSAWREIMGVQTEAELRPNLPGSPPHFGVLYEPEARLEYEAHTGNWVTETGFWVSEEYPFLGASPDGLVGEDGLVEVKVPEFCSRKVLPCYTIQMQIQMIVMRRNWVDFWQWGWRLREFWCQRVYPLSQTGTQALIRRLHDWWVRHVQNGEEPARKVPRRRRKCVAETEMPF